MAAVLKINDLNFKFPNAATPVFDGLSFALEANEFLAVVGGSGVGKSTLLRIIAGLVPASGGSIVLAASYDPKRRRRAMVFQDARLMPWRRVKANVTYGLEGLPITAAERETRIAESLRLVGLSEYSQRWPFQLSGGQRQRVGIARALAVKPDLLLMDEPFGAVDAITRQNLQAELLGVWEASSAGVIFVTHDIEEAVFLADRVIVLGGSPAHIAYETKIPLARPRRRDVPALFEVAAKIAAKLS